MSRHGCLRGICTNRWRTSAFDGFLELLMIDADVRRFSFPSPIAPASVMAPSLPGFSSSSSFGDVDIAAAVDAIIAEAADLCALEKVAKLNTAHLSDSSLLPPDLEARFRKLKLFPATSIKARSTFPPSSVCSAKESIPMSLDRSATAPISPISTKAHADEAENCPPLNHEATTEKLKPKSKSDLSSKPPISPLHSPSPPRQRCCFLLSPKRVVQRRKEKGDDDIDDILSEFGVSRLKEEQRKLRKALKEQKKANKEAEKIVKWMKQASVRMDVASIDEWPSDDEVLK